MEKKKVVLINPPQLNSLDDHLDPPLGLMYLASSLEAQGEEVSICDLSSKSESEWPPLIPRADVYGITLFSASFLAAQKISGLVKKINKDAVLVAGGPHATSLPQETLEGGFDHVIVGEGEVEFPNLVKRISNNETSPSIIHAAPIQDLDSLPFPARYLVDILGFNRNVEGESATSIITSRGCPYSCNFCCKDVHGSKVRFRSADSVIEEVHEVIDTYGIKSFLFYDDVFTFPKGNRLKKLCEGIKQLGITFRCNGRVGVNSLEDYQLLKEAGCMEIAFGIESGSQVILDKMNKGTTVEMNLNAIRNAKQAGLITKAYLITGFPGETQETIDETKRFVEISGVDKFTVSAFVPLPGCDVWKNPLKYGIQTISKDWDQHFNLAGNYEGGSTFTTKDLSSNEFQRLHDDLVDNLLEHGQKGKIEKYYEKLER